MGYEDNQRQLGQFFGADCSLSKYITVQSIPLHSRVLTLIYYIVVSNIWYLYSLYREMSIWGQPIDQYKRGGLRRVELVIVVISIAPIKVYVTITQVNVNVLMVFGGRIAI